MTGYVERARLQVAHELATFIEEEALADLKLDKKAFWTGMAAILERFSPENRALLARRGELQRRIDRWHEVRDGDTFDAEASRSFLSDIGYIVPEPDPFAISTSNVDEELAQLAGPQLVVPVLNARYALNATNARWGSLYDALYGTDALEPPPNSTDYDPQRGARVATWVRDFLDEIVPLTDGSHREARRYAVQPDGVLSPALRDPSAFAGYRGAPESPEAILLCHRGKHIEIVIDRDHPVGRTDAAGIADVVLEAALSTIVDLEDSIAAVDAGDKTRAYANWLGLMRGTLSADVARDGRSFTRRLNPDRSYRAPDGSAITTKGRALLIVRNVGHLMTSDAVRLPDGNHAPEGVLDTVITSLIAMHDLTGANAGRNSRTGSIYIVKPKMHGPDECDFADRLFDAVEDMLDLPRHTIKIGVMDEERRTSVNLAACIAAVRGRIVFVNTGFLDRTGDDIHTSMRAGAMVRKADMKATGWLAAYEQRNVAIALSCGFAGRAQIGKGMWPTPDRMADMMRQKIAHPQSGANTAWVPSPTAAILHAIDYHRVDVEAERGRVKAPADVGALLTIPLLPEPLTAAEIEREVNNNAQSILGYVVRWIDQGVGCSKVPDIDDIGLMEDRATLRISSQHIANWLAHGVCREEQVDAALRKMAVKVDAQNARDPDYTPMAPGFDGVAFQAARALIVEGAKQPNGYTEPLLHDYRARAKARDRNSRPLKTVSPTPQPR